MEDIFQKKYAFYVNFTIQNKTYQQSKTGAEKAVLNKINKKFANTFIYKQLANYNHSSHLSTQK